MSISHQFLTAYCYALSSVPAGLTIPTDPAAALAFAMSRDREADAMLAAGRFEAAERLSHVALEARARATGLRA